MKYTHSERKQAKMMNWSLRLVARYFAKKNGTSTSGYNLKRLIRLVCDQTGWARPDTRFEWRVMITRFFYEVVKVERLQKVRNKIARAPKEDFHASVAWQRLRYQVLQKYGASCQCCGATRNDGVQIHVDHIKPRSKYPDLALEINNLQVLCGPCNLGKSNLDDTDWRADMDDPIAAEYRQIMRTVN